MRLQELGRLRRELVGHAAFSLRIALEAVGHNRLRGALTSLGILFGVASVIAMLAIGRGAEREILEQMQLLGTNNIVVSPLVAQQEGVASDDEEREQKRYSPGLTVTDARSIAFMIPDVDAASGELVLQTQITREGRRRSGKLVGVDTSYFRMLNMSLTDGGFFTDAQVAGAASVCIIGQGVRSRFFTTEQPIGRPIKVGNAWLTVVGVLEDRQIPEQTSQRLGIRDANMDVYVPLATMLLRYRNRAQVTTRDVEQAGRQATVVTSDQPEEDPQQRAERANYHQLDRIVVRVREASLVPPVADVVQRMLERRHNQVIDFEIAIPELLLRQEQRTKTIFNIVLGAIASISLVVGGIGIMNIMLASVLERIREIGVRRAMGATQRDILAQFLSEAVLISVAGGVAGILVGVALSIGIERVADIRTIVSPLSVFVAFAVSCSVGLTFGIVPAWRAAQQDPVHCLRYE
ncbi:MAG: ABC transporter permease [Gemmatimonadota bacterium]|nr:ABC transporter permease [Gemmatimonadota bacterium]